MKNTRTRRTFFEFLGIADQERVHTQMLAWLLDPMNSPLAPIERQHLLANAFDFAVHIENIDTLRVVTELERIDLVVLAADGVLAIENKLKSKQSDGQLASYSIRLQELRRARKIHGDRCFGCFLTFSGEAAGIEGWANVDYALMLRAITPYADRSIYVADYVSLLFKLVTFRDEFLTQHHRHRTVFDRSGMSSRERASQCVEDSETALVQFVTANRLERVFCEALLRHHAERLSCGIHYVDESRGTALIDSRLFSFSFAGESMSYRAGLQLQGAAVKLNMGATRYADSSCEAIASHALKLDRAIANAVSSSSLHVPLRTNAATKKAYRSWSYRLPPESTLADRAIEEFIVEHNERLAWAVAVWSAALEELRREGTVAEFALATRMTGGGEVVAD